MRDDFASVGVPVCPYCKAAMQYRRVGKGGCIGQCLALLLVLFGVVSFFFGPFGLCVGPILLLLGLWLGSSRKVLTCPACRATINTN